MKRTIKTLFLKDGKQICYPSDPECKTLWDQVEKVVIEESYTMEEFSKKYVLIRSYNTDWYCSVCKIYHSQEHSCSAV